MDQHIIISWSTHNDMKKNKILILVMLIASKTINAPTIQENIKIDGIIEENAWSKATIIENWIQQPSQACLTLQLEGRV